MTPDWRNEYRKKFYIIPACYKIGIMDYIQELLDKEEKYRNILCKSIQEVHQLEMRKLKEQIASLQVELSEANHSQVLGRAVSNITNEGVFMNTQHYELLRHHARFELHKNKIKALKAEVRELKRAK